MNDFKQELLMSFDIMQLFLILGLTKVYFSQVAGGEYFELDSETLPCFDDGFGGFDFESVLFGGFDLDMMGCLLYRRRYIFCVGW